MLNISVQASFSAAVLCSLPQLMSLVAVACFQLLGLSLEPERAQLRLRVAEVNDKLGCGRHSREALPRCVLSSLLFF